MKITQSEIKEINDVGNDIDGNKVVHIRTKGGRHLIAKKKINGSIECIGQGSHAGIARHQARQMDKNINWAESLFKSETSQIAISTPEHHYLQAEWHSQQAGLHWSDLKKSNDFDVKLSNTNDYIYHKDMALQHYQMSGLSNREIFMHYNDNMELTNNRPSPFDTIELKKDFIKKNPDVEIKGVE